MINSMTAFARMVQQKDWGMVTVELRSVNHRYLEVAARVPETCRELEMPARELMRKSLQRGKVDCFVNLQLGEVAIEAININAEFLKQLTQAIHKVQQTVGDTTQIDILRLLSWPGVIQTKPIIAEKIQQDILHSVEQALVELIAMREREGEALSNFITLRLDAMEQVIAQIKQQQHAMVGQQRNRILTKLAEVKSELDPGRFEQEMIFFAQKVDIAEELERLKAHISETHKALAQGHGVGRRLDFLMQELHREANTIGSKSTDTEISHWVVDLKVLIEQMREQVQNIE